VGRVYREGRSINESRKQGGSVRFTRMELPMRMSYAGLFANAIFFLISRVEFVHV